MEHVALLCLVGRVLALSSHICLYPHASLVVWGRWPSATLIQKEHVVLLCLVGWVLALLSHIVHVLMQVLLFG